MPPPATEGAEQGLAPSPLLAASCSHSSVQPPSCFKQVTWGTAEQRLAEQQQSLGASHATPPLSWPSHMALLQGLPVPKLARASSTAPSSQPGASGSSVKAQLLSSPRGKSGCVLREQETEIVLGPTRLLPSQCLNLFWGRFCSPMATGPIKFLWCLWES